MNYTLYELLFYFFIYSIFGWCIETVCGAIARKRFENRGFLGGCLCPVYGFTLVFLMVFFDSLLPQVFYLFLGCLVVITVIAFLTGNLMEKLFRVKFWDFSKYRFHAGSYICLRFSLLWAAGAVIILELIQPFLALLVSWIPVLAGKIMLGVLAVVLAADLIATSAAIWKIKLKSRQIQDFADEINKFSLRMEGFITKRVQRRMAKAHPQKEKTKEELEYERQEALAKKSIFAYGCGFYKLIWLFFLGAFLGDITETIFCRLTTGNWMSRSSVVYGPFSIVWGLGVSVFSFLLYRYQSKNDRYIFLSGTVLGGAYEYICSVFTEIAFETVFWDYSGLPFNLGGRINLLYCFFWGIAAVIWMKGVYPLLSKWIEKIPMRFGKISSWVFLVFMVCNVTISGLALARYTDRSNGKDPQNSVDQYLDKNFDNQRMEQIYPNAILQK